MTDQPPKVRRRWKRWTAVAVVLVIGSWVRMVSGESETIRKGRLLRIDMTEAEVRAIMGEPASSVVLPYPERPRENSYTTAGELLVFRVRFALYKLQSVFNPLAPVPDQWPVQVIFDGSGKAWMISRGRESMRRKE